MKTNGTTRVLIPGNEQDNQAIAMAMKLGIELSRKVAADIEGVVLMVPTQKSIRNSGLETVVSEKIAKLLQKGQPVPMGSHLWLRAETTRTFKAKNRKDIVIAIFADSKMMNKVDTMSNLHTVIAVPQKDGALDSWAETWSPMIPGAKKKAEEQMISDPMVETALSLLTGNINLSEPGLTKQGKKLVDRTIRILRRNKHQEESVNVQAWAGKRGWPEKAADELVELWQKVYSLKNTPKVKDVELAKKTYAGWVVKLQ